MDVFVNMCIENKRGLILIMAVESEKDHVPSNAPTLGIILNSHSDSFVADCP